MTVNSETLKAAIRKFIEERACNPGETLDENEDLFFSRRLSSIDILELILFVQETFAIHADPVKFSMETIGTLNRLTRLFSEIGEEV